MANQNLILENEYYRVEILDPKNISDSHFFTRYNYCGYIKQIVDKKSGCNLLASPVTPFSPFSGEGFPDEFESPVGFDSAESGEEFLKIGIGTEVKGGNANYSNRDMHKVSRAAKISVAGKENSTTFYQTSEVGKYAYAYTKSIELKSDKIFIGHELTNCGERAFDTLWYSHAFIGYDKDCANILLRIPSRYQMFKGGENIVETAYADGYNTVKIKTVTDGKKGFCCNWYCDTNENVQNVFIGDRLIYSAQGDYRPDELQVFVNRYAFSIEPKVKINLDSGNTFAWSTEYKLSSDGGEYAEHKI